MRTHQRHLALALSGLIVAGLVLAGCVDEQDSLPEATVAGARVHPDGWKQETSPNFHGKAIRANGWDLASCQTCHGKQYNGGSSNKSCLTCHSKAEGPEDCATCHGSAVNPAPPEDLDGNTSTTVRGVGAHQAHLVIAGGTSGKILACQDCHVVPTALLDIGHIDTTSVDRAEVVMNGALATMTTGGGTIVPDPTYDTTTFGCSTTYCHGTFENGNLTNVPIWTNPATADCGTCHGDKTKTTTKEKALPKTLATGGTHPVGLECARCHTNIDGNASFTNTQAHVDGTINLKDLSNDCSACHGSATNAAPPIDLAGNSAVTNKGVGAHQAHLVGTGSALEVSCSECHTVPATVDLTGADGHIDAVTGAEVVFNGTLARLATSGVTPNPSYMSGPATCGSTYCHGTFKNGNQSNAPVWNSAAGTGAQCGTCHGDVSQPTLAQRALPGGTHPGWSTCQWCHTNVDATPAITNGSSHIDGSIDLVSFNLPADCSRCHGMGSNQAPPVDLDGNTAVTNKGVGAHQAHLAATNAKSLACAECHTVPTTVYEAGHLDSDRPAEVVFNGTLAGLATSGVTPNPSYTSGSATCGSSYCHGTFKNGNQSNAPVWNSAAGSGAQCGSCHGDASKPTIAEKALPTGTHLPYTECQWCHTSVTAGPSFTNVNDHVDGTVPLFQWSTQADCSRCHGSGTNAAPPNDLAGSTSSSKVGAHQAHLNPQFAAAVACSECHSVPANLDYTGADGHLDGTPGAEVIFGTLASKPTDGGAVSPNPVYTSSTLSCGSTYCHGTFKAGNLINAPAWNNPAAAACGTCHGDPVSGNPRPGGSHSTSDNCGVCHTVAGGGPAVATYNSSDTTWTITNKDFHINGKLSVFTAERDPWP